MGRYRAGALAFLAASWLACATSAEAGDITVTGAWARATPPQAKVGAAYLTIENRGLTPDILVRAGSDVAASVQIHETRMAGSSMQMRRVDRLPLAAGATVTLRPGGLHLMLVDLARPLAEGQHFTLSLRFEKAGDVPVEVEVKAPGAVTMAR